MVSEVASEPTGSLTANAPLDRLAPGHRPAAFSKGLAWLDAWAEVGLPPVTCPWRRSTSNADSFCCLGPCPGRATRLSRSGRFASQFGRWTDGRRAANVSRTLNRCQRQLWLRGCVCRAAAPHADCACRQAEPGHGQYKEPRRGRGQYGQTLPAKIHRPSSRRERRFANPTGWWRRIWSQAAPNAPACEQARAPSSRTLLAAKAADASISVAASWGNSPKTRDRAAWLSAAGLSGRVLLVDVDPSEELRRSARNIPEVDVERADTLSYYEIAVADHIVASQAALHALQERVGA